MPPAPSAGILWRRLRGSAEGVMVAGGTGFPMQTEPDQADVKAERGPYHQTISSLASIKCCLVTQDKTLSILCCDPFQKLNAWSVYDYFIH